MNLIKTNNPQHVLLYPPIKDVSEQEIFDAVKASYLKCVLDLNYSADSPQNVAFLINELTNIIISKYGGRVRLPEIKTAFSKGIRGEYGKFFGLSVVTFENFIDAYLNSKEREELGKTIPKIDVPEVPGLNEQFETAKFNAIQAFNSFSEGKNIDVAAIVVYTFLDSLGLIKFTANEKWDFVDQAKIELKRSLDAQKALETRPAERKKLSSTLDELANNGCKDQVIIVSKRITLTAYFQSIMLEESDLNQIMDNQKHVFMANLKKMMEERKDA